GRLCRICRPVCRSGPLAWPASAPRWRPRRVRGRRGRRRRTRRLAGEHGCGRGSRGQRRSFGACAMRLLLDLGNTRVKWGIVDVDGRVAGVAAHDWDAGLATALRGAWNRLPRPRGVWAASVVDADREARVAAALPPAFGAVNWVRTPAEG